MKKIIFILLIVIMLLMTLYNVTYASDYNTSMDGIISGADDFIKKGQTTNHIGFDREGIFKASDIIYNTLLIIAIVVVIIVGAILGMRYMATSVEGQAKVKETLVPYVVGVVIIFGAFGIWKLVTGLLETIN